MMMLFISTAFYCAPHWFELLAYQCVHPTLHMVIFRLNATPLRSYFKFGTCPISINLGRNVLYQDVFYTYMYTIVLTIVPLALLIMLNMCILRRICRSKPTVDESSTKRASMVSGAQSHREVSLLPRISSVDHDDGGSGGDQPEGAVR